MHTEPDEPNAAQRRSDATPDVLGGNAVEERIDNGSTSSGIPAGDEDDGERRKKLYNDGAGLVSRID
ncbi:MAG TPA: hypothetical protein VE379_02610 [Vicinamibacterales bacterium]|nr:hypothetical protein [Vicinamibacterales bacterium]